MEVAVPEEPQKKIFRARKTMKTSDRQQLEVLHNALSSSNSTTSSSASTPMVNGTHTDDGVKIANKVKDQVKEKPKEKDKEKSNGVHGSSSDSPTPNGPVPSSSSSSQPSSPSSPSASSRSKREKTKDGSEENTTSEGEEKFGKEKVSQTPCSSVASGVKSEKDSKTITDDSKTDATTKLASTNQRSPPSLSTPVSLSTTGESEQEVKAGFILSEEEGSPKVKKAKVAEDAEGKNDTSMVQDGKHAELKEKVKTKSEQKEAKLSRSATPPGLASASAGESISSGKKRSLSADNLPKAAEAILGEERVGKRPRVEGIELEAQLELKITDRVGNKLKLEKVVQKLVEEQLRVLELTVFDRTLKELKDRVEKIDCATKHQSTLNTLQAKIARLSKKFGEANQTSENNSRTQEALKKVQVSQASNVTQVTQVAQASVSTPGNNVSRTVRTLIEEKRNQNTTVTTYNSSASPKQTKPLSTPVAPVTSSPLATPATPASFVQIKPSSTITATTSTTSSSNNHLGSVASTLTVTPTPTVHVQAQMGQSMGPTTVQATQGQALLVKTGPAGQVGTSLQPVLLIPVSSLPNVTNASLSKTTTATPTFILQQPKTALTAVATTPGTAVTQVVPSIAPGVTVNAAAVPASPTVAVSSPAMTIARPLPPGGGTGGLVSVTTARAPTQSAAAIVGVSTSSSTNLASSVPAATGAAASATPSASAMTSKTDNQASSNTIAKAGAQPATGSVIDLTDEDDDVQMTGIKMATVSTTRPSRPPPPLISSGPAARASPQTSQKPQITVHQRPPLDSPSQSRVGSSSSTPPSSSSSSTKTHSLPPLPPAPAAVRVPPEASLTKPPQQPELRLGRVQSQNGIVLSWGVEVADPKCAAAESYHLYAYHQEAAAGGSATSGSGLHWKKIGEVKALPLPMACTLTQFVSGSTYYFAVRGRDSHGRFGPFCDPQCTDVISATPASSSRASMGTTSTPAS